MGSRSGLGAPAKAAKEKISSMQERIRTFVLDASRVSGDLDQVSRRDGPAACAQAVEKGKHAYEELLARQGSLVLPPADSAHIQLILDGIRARLKFLS